MIILGFHAVLDAVEKSGFAEGDRLLIARQSGEGRMQALLTKARRANIPVIQKGYGELNQIAGSKNHQGIVLERKADLELKTFTKQDFVAAEQGVYLALDAVQDPQNLGAICRTAVGLSVAGIFLPQKESAPAGATALKASAGALSEIPLCFTGSIASLMQYTSDKRPEIPMVAIATGSQLFGSEDTDELSGIATPVLVVVGSEQGLSRLALERATHTRSLPMSDRIESYNVSVAVAMALHAIHMLKPPL
jgi:23S rRNA (guanosine2251-2'-O)-methyltransferase